MNSVIIPASGVGKRFGAELPKQFASLKGQDILWHTIKIFEDSPAIGEIAVTVPPGFKDRVASYGFAKVRHIIDGGETRAASVNLALKALDPSTRVVLVHDGVRPFVTEDIIAKVIAGAEKNQAVITGLPVTDTIKVVYPAGRVARTVDRRHMWQIQTPQGFTYDILTKAYAQAEKTNSALQTATDDASLVEQLGQSVHIIEGSKKNIKITTPEDFEIAEQFMN